MSAAGLVEYDATCYDCGEVRRSGNRRISVPVNDGSPSDGLRTADLMCRTCGASTPHTWTDLRQPFAGWPVPMAPRTAPIDLTSWDVPSLKQRRTRESV